LNVGAKPIVQRAEMIVSQIFASVEVQIVWHGDMRLCSKPSGGIAATMLEVTPPSLHKGALGYASPYEGWRIAIFYDRVLSAAPWSDPARVLAHTLAHEITHILQAIDRHSETGIMKGCWKRADFVEMQLRELPFSEDDIFLIRRGLEMRSRRGTR